MPKKKPTITALKNRLWKLVSAEVKIRDNYTCWYCQTRCSGSNANASHILPKGEFPRYEFELWNLKTLCLHCHIQFWHKNPIFAAIWFKEFYPKKYQEALDMAAKYKDKKPYSYQEIESLIEKYKAPITW